MLDKITERLDRDPFRPFQIVLTNGDRYDVVNPHLVALMQSEVFYAYPRSNKFAFLRLNQIAAVETLNGQ
jgi:hypothetical protein